MAYGFCIVFQVIEFFSILAELLLGSIYRAFECDCARKKDFHGAGFGYLLELQHHLLLGTTGFGFQRQGWGCRSVGRKRACHTWCTFGHRFRELLVRSHFLTLDYNLTVLCYEGFRTLRRPFDHPLDEGKARLSWYHHEGKPFPDTHTLRISYLHPNV
jgi:hypothetical protein